MLKTITAAAIAIAIAIGPAFADATAKVAQAKPDLPRSEEGTPAKKAECLSGAGFAETTSPAAYQAGVREGRKVFYISDRGVTAVPRQHIPDARERCGKVLGEQH